MKGIYPCNQQTMELARESLPFAANAKRINRIEKLCGRTGGRKFIWFGKRVTSCQNRNHIYHQYMK